MTKTHKASGWKRQSFGDGSMRFRIIPTDDSGARVVSFMSAGSWANYPQDDRARQHEDRVVLLEGPALPDWAMRWLESANAKSCGNARSAFRDMCDQADMDTWNRYGNSY